MAQPPSKLPAFQFYPGDWKRDIGVQSLSLHDRHVWFELLLLMHDSEKRGFLLLNGKPMSDAAAARNIGMDIEDYRISVKAITEAGVNSYDASGVMFSRRLVRDEELRIKRREAGKLGGNPILKSKKTKGTLDKQKDNHRDIQGSNQNPTPSSSFSSSILKKPLPLTPSPAERGNSEASRSASGPKKTKAPSKPVERSQKAQTTSPPNQAPATRRNPTSASALGIVEMGESDLRRMEDFKAEIFVWFAQLNGGVECTWGRNDQKALDEFVVENPSVDRAMLQACLRNRSASIIAGEFLPTDPPRKWLRGLLLFLHHPITKSKRRMA